MHAPVVALALALPLAPGRAAAPPQDLSKPWVPYVEPASDEAVKAMARFKLPAGFAAHLFAAEPRVANIVSFAIDDGGDVYVAETFRAHEGTIDLRDYMDWLDDDLACRSVDDRVAMIKKWEKGNFDSYTRASERIKRLRDTDRDGVADQDVVFADDFRDPACGLGAGVLVHQGKVYYTCIPDLWLLEDKDRDGRADARTVLSHGYGVHTAMIGHDLHGLCIGPDGRLYFSSGDRALRVETEHGVIDHTHTGAVLRCNLDGTGLEVFATGLRNPQELAFDELGNLFTGDNNSDGGDKARFVHVIEGSDSGYRYGYQWMEDPHQRGPWNEEKLWHPHFKGQAAYIVPPLSWMGEGPAGLAYHPGTGLTDRWRRHFFLCNYTGDAKSAIFAISVKPKGATYAVDEKENFVSGSCATDCEFGLDGALWWSDWVTGWRRTGKGRIWRAVHPDTAERGDVQRARALLEQGMAKRSVAELAQLLFEPDQRVRLRAELELAARGAEGAAALASVVDDAPELVSVPGASDPDVRRLARLHGLWGLGMAARAGVAVETGCIVRGLTDADPEVRAQAAQACGDLALVASSARLIDRLADTSPRVRMLAAIALGKLKVPGAVQPLLGLARATGESDPALRHGIVMGLQGCADAERLVAVREDPSPDVRIAAVVALRRQKSWRVVSFVADPDERVATEVARVVWDLGGADGWHGLAARLDAERLGEPPLVRRALAACLRIGDEQGARSLARFVRRKDASQPLRAEALEHLSRWTDPPSRDPITGEWRPFARTEAEKQAAAGYLSDIVRQLGAAGIADEPEELAGAWLRLVRSCRVRDMAPQLARQVFDPKRSQKLRAAALRACEDLDPPDILDLHRRALTSADPELRIVAMESLRRRQPGETLAIAEQALQSGAPGELRFAYESLAGLATAPADAVLGREVDRLNARLIPAEVELDLLEAAEQRLGARLEPRLPLRAAAQQTDPQVAPWLECLYGGDERRGRRVFRDVKLQCLRCHKTDGDEGGSVGPSLAGIGTRSTRLQILESIVSPNRRIAPGYQGATFDLRVGPSVSGRVEREAEGRLWVRTSDDQLLVVTAADVTDRRSDISSMPDGLAAALSRQQMRDLIAFLASLDKPVP